MLRNKGLGDPAKDPSPISAAALIKGNKVFISYKTTFASLIALHRCQSFWALWSIVHPELIDLLTIPTRLRRSAKGWGKMSPRWPPNRQKFPVYQTGSVTERGIIPEGWGLFLNLLLMVVEKLGLGGGIMHSEDVWGLKPLVLLDQKELDGVQ